MPLIQGFVISETDSIPMDLLARQDPVLDKIIFYDDVSLFEDELHDNGESVMNVRIVSVPTHRACIYHEFQQRELITFPSKASDASFILHLIKIVPPRG